MQPTISTPSLESAEAVYISKSARAKLAALHSDKITDFHAFFQELQMGVSLFNIAHKQRESAGSELSIRDDISEFSSILSNVETLARKLAYTSTGIAIQEAYSDDCSIEKLENFANDVLRLKVACDSVHVNPKKGQKSWDTDIAYFTYKALSKYRTKRIALSDNPSSVLVKTIKILLEDISTVSSLGKLGCAGDMVVSDTSAVGMVRNLKKALRHKE